MMANYKKLADWYTKDQSAMHQYLLERFPCAQVAVLCNLGGSMPFMSEETCDKVFRWIVRMTK